MSERPQVSRAKKLAYLAKISADALEALAGAGDLSGANQVLSTMLEFDRTPPTLALLRDHAVRAGWPDLVPPA